MKNIKYLVVLLVLILTGSFGFQSKVQAANQYGYPEALYNSSMDRWEADLSESPLYEGTQDMQFYGFVFWAQDPILKNMIYNTISFSPGGPGSYNQVAIEYPKDNGIKRGIYLLYVGPVKVEYKESGTENTLASLTYLSGHEGEAYVTQGKQIPGYQLDYVQGSESGNYHFLGADYGSVGNPNLSSAVTYYYKKLPVPGANVAVNYVDEQGNLITTSEELSGNVGETYTSIQKSIPGYSFKEVQGNASGMFTTDPQTVTYIYIKDLIPGAKVTVNYVDEQGTPITSSEELSGNMGDMYTSVQKSIPGYRFKEIQGNASGVYTSLPQTVTYVYTKDSIPGGKVTVNYVDEQGNKITGSEELTGNVGGSYTSVQKSIPGYRFKEIQGNASGVYTSLPQTITYVYTKDSIPGGKVTVNYVDEQGNKITGSEELTGNVGGSYTSVQKSVPGYRFKGIQGNASGIFTSDSQIITYIYAKNILSPSKNSVDMIRNSYTHTHYYTIETNTMSKEIASTKETLPKTGEDDKVSMFLNFVGILSMFSIIVLLISKQRKLK